MEYSATFGMRFGFVLWLRMLIDGEAPTYAEIGRKVGRTGPAIGAWMKSSEAPIDYRIHASLARCLGVNERWFITGEGSPPDAELWLRWLEARGEAAGLTATVVRPLVGKRASDVMAARQNAKGDGNGGAKNDGKKKR